MNCGDVRQRLDKLIFEELTEEERHEIELHLATCRSCIVEVAALRQWKQLVKKAGQRFAPSSQLRRRIEEKYRARLFSRHDLPISVTTLSATIIVALGLLFCMDYQNKLVRKQVFGEIVDQHSATVSNGASLDVASSDYMTVESWFRGKIPFNLRIPELRKVPFSLVGARLVFIHQTSGAQLILASQTGQISAFTFPENEFFRRSFREHDTIMRLDPFNVQMYGNKDFRYVIVGTVDPGTLHQLADLFDTAH